MRGDLEQAEARAQELELQVLAAVPCRAVPCVAPALGGMCARAHHGPTLVCAAGCLQLKDAMEDLQQKCAEVTQAREVATATEAARTELESDLAVLQGTKG